jgi:ribosome-associated toxin RatA of RatAB toxin-antitoxin module
MAGRSNLKKADLAGGGRLRDLISIKTIIISLAVIVVPGNMFPASDSGKSWNPREMMAVTVDQSVFGEGNGPEVLEALLEVGEVIIIDKNPEGVPWLASAGIIMDTPIETAYEAVTDFNSYPEFMPQTEGARVKEVAPNLYDVEFDIVVRIVYIPVKGLSAIYHYNRPPHRTDWAGKDQEFALNYGYWQLAPIDGGRRTMGFYTIYSKINQGIAKQLLELDPALEMMAAMSAATIVVRAMKDRAEFLHQRAVGEKPPPSSSKHETITGILTENQVTVEYLASKGRLLVLEEGDQVITNVAVVFDHPPEAVWEWLVNVDDQSGNDPHINVEVLEKTESGMLARFKWEISLVLTFEADYVLRYELDRPRRLTWRNVPGEGNVEGMEGSWDLIPLDNGKRTLAVFRNTFDLESLGWVMRALLKIEPTFELAIQASQNLAVVDNLEECLELSAEERQKKVQQRSRALEEHRKLPLREGMDFTPSKTENQGKDGP